MFYFDSPQLKTTFSTDSRVQNMFDILLDDEMEKDKREKVGNFFCCDIVVAFFCRIAVVWFHFCYMLFHV